MLIVFRPAECDLVRGRPVIPHVFVVCFSFKILKDKKRKTSNKKKDKETSRQAQSRGGHEKTGGCGWAGGRRSYPSTTRRTRHIRY